MTNQEAIKMLTSKVECIRRETSGTDIDCNFHNCDDCELCYAQGTTGEQRKALNMAISALQAQEQIRWERDIAIQQLKELGYGLGEEIRTDDDLISRQAAIDAFMTATSDGDKADWCKWVLEQLPSAQPEPCADAVSRADVINFLCDWICAPGERCVSDCKCLKGIRELPSVMPVRDCKGCRFKFLPERKEYNAYAMH